jgi:uncharacterized membrane protein
MTDTPPVEVEQPVRWEWRYVLGVLTVAQMSGIVWWCMLYGRSENLLHQNAESWAFIIIGAVLAGLGLGAALPALTGLLGRK